MAFMHLVGLATAGLAVGVTVATLGRSPAFVEDLRQTNVYGQWRLANSHDMYDAGSYLFQLGYGYLHADALFSADTEGVGEVASVELAFERAEQGRDLLKESLTHAPANAHTWAHLAAAHLMLSELDEAVAALEMSYRLAPHSRLLADRRVGIAGLLYGELNMGAVPFTEAAKANLARDIAALDRFDRRALEFHRSQFPLLEAL